MSQVGQKIAIYDVFADRVFDGNQAAVIRSHCDSFSNAQLVTLAGELSLAETVIYKFHGNDLELRFANADRIVKRCGHASLAAVADHILSGLRKNGTGSEKWTGRYHVASAVGQWRAWSSKFDCSEHKSNGINVSISWPDRPKQIRRLPPAAAYRSVGLDPTDCPRGLFATIYSSGNRNALVPVNTVTALKHAKPDLTRMMSLFEQYHLTDLHLFCLAAHAASYQKISLRCRNVFPYGVFEEVATGTASVAVATYLVDSLPALRHCINSINFSFNQGNGRRRGKLHVNWCRQSSGEPTIWLRGQVFPVVLGNLVAVPER